MFCKYIVKIKHTLIHMQEAMINTFRCQSVALNELSHIVKHCEIAMKILGMGLPCHHRLFSVPVNEIILLSIADFFRK